MLETYVTQDAQSAAKEAQALVAIMNNPRYMRETKADLLQAHLEEFRKHAWALDHSVKTYIQWVNSTKPFKR